MPESILKSNCDTVTTAAAPCCSKSKAPPHVQAPVSGFWGDRGVWVRSARNTFTCLIGCSIGDFSMLAYLQSYHPGMMPFIMMLWAMSAGLLSSIVLETGILMVKDRFRIGQALQTAFSMSFISMLAMETTENAVDYWITGFTAEVGTAFWWFALGAALIAGFLVPWPYNYWKLKKHGKSCH